jgi:hypothetical protein
VELVVFLHFSGEVVGDGPQEFPTAVLEGVVVDCSHHCGQEEALGVAGKGELEVVLQGEHLYLLLGDGSVDEDEQV